MFEHARFFSTTTNLRNYDLLGIRLIHGLSVNQFDHLRDVLINFEVLLLLRHFDMTFHGQREL